MFATGQSSKNYWPRTKDKTKASEWKIIDVLCVFEYSKMTEGCEDGKTSNKAEEGVGECNHA